MRNLQQWGLLHVILRLLSVIEQSDGRIFLNDRSTYRWVFHGGRDCDVLMNAVRTGRYGVNVQADVR